MVGEFRYYKYSLMKSTDGGTSWFTARSGEWYPGPIAVDPLAAGTGLSGLGYSRIGRSTDYGNTWTETLLPVSANIVTLSIDPRTPSVLYAGTEQGVFKSTDGAADSSPANTGLSSANVQVLAIDPVTPTTLYAGTERGLSKSVDGGATWSAAGNDLGGASVHDLTINPQAPDILYAGTPAGSLQERQRR